MEALYPEITSFIEEIPLLAASKKLDTQMFSPEWAFLQSSEEKLSALMNKKTEPEGPGEPEYGMVLHGGIPIGKAYGLNSSVVVDYNATTPVTGGGPTLVNRVLNGFAMLTISDYDLTEEVYEVQNLPGNIVGKQVDWKSN